MNYPISSAITYKRTVPNSENVPLLVTFGCCCGRGDSTPLKGMEAWKVIPSTQQCMPNLLRRAIKKKIQPGCTRELFCLFSIKVGKRQEIQLTWQEQALWDSAMLLRLGCRRIHMVHYWPLNINWKKLISTCSCMCALKPAFFWPARREWAVSSKSGKQPTDLAARESECWSKDGCQNSGSNSDENQWFAILQVKKVQETAEKQGGQQANWQKMWTSSYVKMCNWGIFTFILQHFILLIPLSSLWDRNHYYDYYFQYFADWKES